MYAHKKDIISSYEIASEDGFLHTREYSHPVIKGDHIITNLDGDQYIISDEYAEKLMSIKFKPQPKRKTESPFAERQKIEMANGCGMSPNESLDYIRGFDNGWNNYDRCTAGKK